MTVFLKKKAQKGFSLVELMIVVAIIGILAALAVPRFQAFQAKAKAAEANTSLSHAYTLELSYHGDNDTYGSLSDIGFSLNGSNAASGSLTSNTAAKIRYDYSTTSSSTTAFLIQAQATAGKLGGCQTGSHTVLINQNKALGSGVTTSSTTSNAAPIPGC